MSWPRVPLCEVATLEREGELPSSLSADTPYIGLEHIDGDGTLCTSATVGSAELKSTKFHFCAEHVLFGKLRPYLRKIARPDFEGVCSTDIIPIRAGKRLDRAFLFHFLRSPSMVSLATSRCSGANLPRLSPTQLESFEVPVPPLPEQKRIAAILDSADALRAKRRASIDQLDALVQSTFLEMFGDPVMNPKGFPVRSLSELYIDPNEGTKCGPFGSALKKEEYVQAGVPVWNMDNISPQGRVVMPFRMWVTAKKYCELEAYAVHDGDVLISRAGTVGKMCVANTGGLKSILSTNLIRVRFGRNLLPLYFVSLMTYCKGRVGRLEAGPDGAFTHMSTKVLDRLTFPYPPLDLQTHFAAIVEAIEQQRARLKAHLAELDALFASLQSRAFSGEICSRSVSRQHSSA